MKITKLKTCFTFMVGACLLQALAINPAFADPKIKYGEWEINIAVDSLPLAVPLQTQHICIDKEHLVPGEKQAGQCKIKWQLAKNTVDWKMTCTNGGSGKGHVRYEWDTLHGSSEMTLPGAQMSLHSSLTGKWVAAYCSAQSRSLP